MKYAVSDIHGNYAKYKKLLDKLDLKEDDTLYVLGDVLDRGTRGFHIMLDMAKRPNVVGLMGNHEAMAMDALPGLLRMMRDGKEKLSASDKKKISLWFGNSGALSLADYLWLNQKDAETVLDYMNNMPLYKEVQAGDKDFVLVHGGLGGFSPSKPLEEYDRDDIVWHRPQKDTEYYADKHTVFGHTPTPFLGADIEQKYDSLPKIYHGNRWSDIDCGCGYEDGRLGCLCLDNMEEVYV